MTGIESQNARNLGRIADSLEKIAKVLSTQFPIKNAPKMVNIACPECNYIFTEAEAKNGEYECHKCGAVFEISSMSAINGD